MFGNRAGTSDTLAGQLNDEWYALHGVVPPDTKAAIIQGEAGGLVQASAGNMSQADALAQANSDVNTALDTFSAPGAFGITWTGANPDASSFEISNPSTWPWYVWAAIIGGGALLTVVVVKEVL